MLILFLFFALLTGMMLGVQGVVNSTGEKVIGLPSMLAFLSFVQGIPPLIYILIHKPHLGLLDSIFKGWEWFVITGLMSALTVVGITVSISKIGALVTFVLVVLGQIITSAIIDHFGLLGMEINPINLLKITSILIILVGVFLLIKPNADDIGTDSSEIQSKA